MAKAGTREKPFRDFCNKVDNKLLTGKIIFKNGKYEEVSVDESIILGNKLVLIEIDSSNEAKLVAGQYTLLNILRNKPLVQYEQIVKGKELVFFVIHCFKKYNPERSKGNFSLVNREVFNDEGLKYGSIHIDDIMNETIDSKEKLLNVINEHIR